VVVLLSLGSALAYGLSDFIGGLLSRRISPWSVAVVGQATATVLTLGAHMCKWPIGDPSTSEFSFCGRRASEGPYCGEHAQVAYQPAQKKGRSAASELARSLRRYI